LTHGQSKKIAHPRKLTT